MTTAAMQIASANAITIDCADAIADAYASATGEWTGLDWSHIQSHGMATIEIPAGTTAEETERMADEADARADAMPGSADDLYLIQAKEAVEDEAAAYRDAAQRIAEITAMASEAEREAAEAIAHAMAGDLESACASADWACTYEREASGDCVVWSPLALAIEAAVAQMDEDDEDEDYSEID